MLKGEAVSKAIKWREQIANGKVVIIETEELKQFLDVALWEMEKGTNPTQPNGEILSRPFVEALKKELRDLP